MRQTLLCRVLAVLAVGLLAASAGAAPDEPLPTGARLRLGNVRLQHGGPVRGLAFAADGKTLASAARDHTVRLWNLPAGRESLRLRHEWVCRVALSPDGKLLASAGDDGTLYLWDARTGKQLRRLAGHRAAVLCLAFSPDSRTLLSGSADQTARLWRVADGSELLQFAKEDGPIKAALFAPGGKHLVTAARRIRLWKIGGEELRSFAGSEAASCLALAPDGKSLAAVDGSDIQRWDPTTGRALSILKGAGTSVVALAFTPGGKTLVSSEAGGTLRLWGTATGKEIRVLRCPGSGVSAGVMALSPDGNTIACAGTGNDIELRETATGKLLPLDGAGPQRIVTVACSADGKRIVTGSRDGPVCLRDAVTGRNCGRLGKRGAGGSAVALSADGKVLAACGEDGVIRIWDVAARKEIRTLPARPKGKPSHLLFSPDSRMLAVGFAGRDDAVQLFDSLGKLLRTLPVLPNLTGLAYAPDGKLLATASEGHGVSTWNVTEGRRVRGYGTSEGAGGGLAFSPDGRLLAAAGPDGVISLFDVATAEALRHLAGHEGAVHALAFAPDGRLLASGGNDPLVGLWEVASGQAVRRFAGHAGAVRFVAFLPDGRGLLSASDDATALLWDVTGRLANDPRPPASASAELRRLWEDLAGFEAARAYRAVWTLGDNPEQSVGLVLEGLIPVLGVSAERIGQLIAQLDHNRFSLREKASDALRSLGNLAEPALRRAQAKKGSPEAARRIKELLDRLKTNPLFAEQERLRRLRSLSVLEQAGTAPARKVLGEVAQGAADEELRQAAREALRRLGGRGP